MEKTEIKEITTTLTFGKDDRITFDIEGEKEQLYIKIDYPDFRELKNIYKGGFTTNYTYFTFDDSTYYILLDEENKRRMIEFLEEDERFIDSFYFFKTFKLIEKEIEEYIEEENPHLTITKTEYGFFTRKD